MLITYVGFVQRGSVRSYNFEGRPDGGSRREVRQIALSITADMSIVSRFGVRLQDLPALCQRTLSTAVSTLVQGEKVPASFVLTEAHVRDYCAIAMAPVVRSDHRKRFHAKPTGNSQIQWTKKV